MCELKFEQDPAECPACGEISLREARTIRQTHAFIGPTTFIVYECDECGHEESS